MSNSAPFCMECGNALPAEAKFCPQCGTKAAPSVSAGPDAPTAHVETPDPLEALLPADLRAKFEAARQELRGERREVVVLFADVSGYTAMSEGLDPEEVSLIMQGLMRELADAVYRYEGYVDKYIGDAIMALFGAPVAHEDDPERAIFAALDMLEVLARRREEGSHQIHLRVGLNIGEVVAAHMGSEMRLQYTVMGDAVNVASRLESKAEPDTILISHALCERVSSLFETEEVPPLTVKGKSEPLRAHRVLRYRPAAKAREDKASPFVGRDAELEFMADYFRRLESAEAAPLLIEAEAGAGKSRLLQEAASRIPVEPARIDIAFSPIQLPGQLALIHSIFRKLAESFDSGDPLRAATDLLLTLGSEADEHRSGFEGLLEASGLAAEKGPVDPTKDPQVERQNRWLALSALLRAASQTRAILLVFEDIHFAAEADEEFLGFLLPVLRGKRIAIVLTARPGAHRPWIPPDVERLFLRRLGAEDVRAFLGDLYERLRPSVRRDLIRRSQGNPLYLEELARSLRESGDEIVTSVPGTLQGLLQSRIDRLETPQQLLLQMGAVLGTEFATGLLARMYALESQPLPFDRALGDLREGGFIEPDERDDLHRFRHALMQEVAYGRLLLRVRKVLHESAARLGEGFYADRLEAEAAFFAHHYWEADLKRDAAPHLRRAGLSAAGEYELQKAEAFFDRLAAVLEKEPDIVADPGELVAVAESYGYVLLDRGRLDVAEKWFGTLGELGEAHNRAEWAVRSLWYRGWIAYNLSQLDRSEALFQDGLSRLSSHDPRAQADLHSGLGLVHANRGNAREALREHREALRVRQDVDDFLGMAKSLMNIGTVHFHLTEDYAAAEEHYEQALEYTQRAGDRRMRCGVLLNLASLALDRGQWVLALSRLEQVNELAEEMGWSFMRFLSLRNEAECHLHLGQIGRALAALNTCLKQGEEALLPVNRVAARLLLFEAYASALDSREASKALEAAVVAAQQLEIKEADDWLRICAGRSLGDERKWAEAARLFEEARRLAADLQHPHFEKLAQAHLFRASSRNGWYEDVKPPEETGEGGPIEAVVAYLVADGRAARETSRARANELRSVGERAAGIGYRTLERAAFEREAEVWEALGDAERWDRAMKRAAVAMRTIADGLPDELRNAFLEHPRNAALRTIVAAGGAVSV